MRFTRLLLLFIFCLFVGAKVFSQEFQVAEHQISIDNEFINQSSLSTAYSYHNTHNPYEDDIMNETLSALDNNLVDELFVIAKDDDAETNEDIPVKIEVLSNDNVILSTIDPATVDLDVDKPDVQNEVSLTTGLFQVNAAGEVIFTPASNYYGTVTLNYTVKDNFDQTSNEATITVTITPVNDAPRITGQTPEIISSTEDTDFTILLSNLTIDDPDNSNFTLNILPGTNYIVDIDGTTIKPTLNYYGPLNVNVNVNDGFLSSETFEVSVNLSPVNDAPEIIGQAPSIISATEDTGFTLSVSNLEISDPENSNFTLTILPSTNYSVSEGVITPKPQDYNGPLTVNVSVSDGLLSSKPFEVAVNVVAVNDAPDITGQTPTIISATEDTDFTLSLSYLNISDPDNVTFTLNILPGTHYTFNDITKTITPSPKNYNGPLTVNVNVNDGLLSSETFGVAVNVAAVNDAPDITGQTPTPIAATENSSFTLLISNLNIVDPDNSTFTLEILPGTGYTYNQSTKSITPSPNYNGPLTVNVSVSDGLANSESFAVAVNVTAVNNAPSITGQNPATIPATEDTNFTLALSNLNIVDPDNSTFTLEILPGTGYTYNQLNKSIIPTPNYSGPLTVNVRVSDGALNSAPFGVAVSVAAVNDPPSFNEISDVIIFENDGAQTLSVTGISSGPLEAQNMLLKATSGNTSLIPTPTVSYNGTASTATISFKPTAAQTGTAIITVSLVDAGLSEFTRTFQIQVTSINDAPTLDVINTVTIQEDAILQNVALTGIGAGAGETQALSVSVSSNNQNLFETLEVLYTSPQQTGTLKIKPIANASGTAQITITVTDDGLGTPFPNDNNTSRVFTLNVQPVNDPPFFLSTPKTLAIVGELFADSVLTGDIDNATVTVVATAKPGWLTLSASANGKKVKISGIPPTGSGGTIPIALQVKDGVAQIPQSYNLIVDTRPKVNLISLVANEDVPLILTAQSFSSAFTDADGNAISQIKFTKLPKHGSIKLNSDIVNLNDEIPFASISNLTYNSNSNYYGRDTLQWNASDGIIYSNTSAFVTLIISPLNDAPVITGLEADSLKYEIGIDYPIQLTAMFNAVDPDGDSLVRAEIGFRSQNFQSGKDELSFTNTDKITGLFDSQTGILALTGKASAVDYVNAIRSILYRYKNTDNPDLKIKSVYITLSDGKALGDTKDRFIRLIYSFEDLQIINGFTPNGDEWNESWALVRPDQEYDLRESKLRVYSKEGLLVFESKGFDTKWNGKYNNSGQLLPAGSYIYTFEAVDSKLKSFKKVYKGIVNVLY